MPGAKDSKTNSKEVQTTGNEQVFGMVRNGGFYVFAPQHLEGKTVKLTTAAMDDSQRPESNEIDLSMYKEKIIEVNGIYSGDWIYSARVVEEAGPVLTDFLKKVFLKEEVQKKRCALVVGHQKESQGAVNTKIGVTEFQFNEGLLPKIEHRVKNTTIHRVYRKSYSSLPGDINDLNPDFVVSLHCNSYDGSVSGSEVLFYHRSLIGKEMAGILLEKLVNCLNLPDRGIKPKTTEDRGGYLLRYTTAPCIISEPFFIDNDSDLARAMEKRDELAEAYAIAIDEISEFIQNEDDINIDV
jgi:N-acetylmuramoyl-L-alanine amidase